MNELTLFVKYSPLSKTVATALCAYWAIFAFFMMSFLYPFLHQTHWTLQIAQWLGFGLMFVYVPFVIVSFYREGGLLAVTDDGLTLPPAFLGFGPHKSIRWSTLKFIDFDSSKLSLHLQTEDGKKVKINTRKIPQTEVEQLMFAVEVLSPQAAWSAPASDFKDNLQNAKLGIESDFTHMWEAELKRRYSVTTFAPHPPGTLLQNGRLSILKQLAFGGFSAVYLAEDEDRQRVVVKELVLNADGASDYEKALELFERESMLLAKINHPNIVKVFDHFVEGNRHYLVLDHIDGENLRQLVTRNGVWDEPSVIALAIQMASILEDLHGLNPPLIHRDFTPDNLMLTANKQLTLVDFGAANECVSAMTGTLIGKQSYMPIEQIRGKAEPRSDLYALGGTIYFLLTATDPEPLSTITLPTYCKLKTIVEKLTQMEPEQRFLSAGHVRLALSELSGKSNSSLLATNRFENNV